MNQSRQKSRLLLRSISSPIRTSRISLIPRLTRALSSSVYVTTVVFFILCPLPCPGLFFSPLPGFSFSYSMVSLFPTPRFLFFLLSGFSFSYSLGFSFFLLSGFFFSYSVVSLFLLHDFSFFPTPWFLFSYSMAITFPNVGFQLLRFYSSYRIS